MKCIECGGESQVHDSRPIQEYGGYDFKGGSIRRRRRCISCNARWSTVEVRIDALDEGHILSRLTNLKAALTELLRVMK